jgi:[ribosomal protein S5]-alanine N-acetyltransferase
MTSTISTHRLQLRPLGLRDALLMHKTFAIPGFTDGMYYKGPVSLWFALKAVIRPKGVRFSIRLKGKPIGSIWLIHRKSGWNLGFWLHPDFQGKGYMTEAVGALLDFAARSLKMKQVHAGAFPWNRASQNVLLSNGFVFLEQKDGELRYVREL